MITGDSAGSSQIQLASIYDVHGNALLLNEMVITDGRYLFQRFDPAIYLLIGLVFVVALLIRLISFQKIHRAIHLSRWQRNDVRKHVRLVLQAQLVNPVPKVIAVISRVQFQYYRPLLRGAVYNHRMSLAKRYFPRRKILFSSNRMKKRHSNKQKAYVS